MLHLPTLLSAFELVWPADRSHPPTAPWMRSYLTRPQAVAVYDALRRTLPGLAESLEGTTAEGALERWVGATCCRDTAAFKTFWRRVLYQSIQLHEKQRKQWENPGILRPRVMPVTRTRRRSVGAQDREAWNRTLWWLPRYVRFQPEQWLEEVLSVGPMGSQPPEYSWSTKLDDGQLRVSLYPRRERDDSRDEVGHPYVLPDLRSTPVVQMEWLDRRGTVTRQAEGVSFQGVQRYLKLQRGSWPTKTFNEMMGVLNGLSDAQVDGGVHEGAPHDASQPLDERLSGDEEEAPNSQYCRDRPEPASVAGRLNGRAPCCYFEPHQAARVIHVSKGGDPDSTGVNSRHPTTIEVLQAMLKEPLYDWGYGLHIRFLRGEHWNPGDCAHSSEGYYLKVLARGVERRPIIIDSYYNTQLSRSNDYPVFDGDGHYNVRTDTPTRATMQGFILDGSEWVQVQEIEIMNCDVGIIVRSLRDQGPLWGARNINLHRLIVRENWRIGIQVHSGIDKVAEGEGVGESKVVIGDGFVAAIDITGVHAPVELNVEPHGWWPELICIEDCEVYANGDGNNSAGGNLDISAFSSRCTIRHNKIYGANHHRSWPNKCAWWVNHTRFRPGDACETPNQGYYLTPDDPDQRLMWGTDGITMTNGGCGHLIENNLIFGHVVGQSSKSGDCEEGNCGADDGNGIDLKSVGNRTYWETVWVRESGGYRPERRLQDLPIVIRNNRIYENQAPGLIMHFGTENVHVYNNVFSYNLGNDGAAITLIAGFLENGQWSSQYPAYVFGLAQPDESTI